MEEKPVVDGKDVNGVETPRLETSPVNGNVETNRSLGLREVALFEENNAGRNRRGAPPAWRLYIGAFALFVLIVAATPIVLLWACARAVWKLVSFPLRSDGFSKMAT